MGLEESNEVMKEIVPSLDESIEASPPNVPERELLAAILIRALQDLCETDGVPREYRITARQWFASRFTGPWSFAWVLEHLELSRSDLVPLMKRCKLIPLCSKRGIV